MEVAGVVHSEERNSHGLLRAQNTQLNAIEYNRMQLSTIEYNSIGSECTGTRALILTSEGVLPLQQFCSSFAANVHFLQHVDILIRGRAQQ